MNTAHKSDTCQTKQFHAVSSYSTNEYSTPVTPNELQTDNLWNSAEHNNHHETAPIKENNIKLNWAKIIEGDYIWIVGDSNQTSEAKPYRLASSQVEQALVSHPKVKAAAIVGLPHEQRGNEIHAFVQLKENTFANNDLEQTLKDLVNKHIGTIAIPQHIEFVDFLPKSTSGEVMRKALKTKALEQKLIQIN